MLVMITIVVTSIIIVIVIMIIIVTTIIIIMIFLMRTMMILTYGGFHSHGGTPSLHLFQIGMFHEKSPSSEPAGYPPFTATPI